MSHTNLTLIIANRPTTEEPPTKTLHITLINVNVQSIDPRSVTPVNY